MIISKSSNFCNTRFQVCVESGNLVSATYVNALLQLDRSDNRMKSPALGNKMLILGRLAILVLALNLIKFQIFWEKTRRLKFSKILLMISLGC